MIPRRTDGSISLSRFIASDAAAICEADRDPEHRRRFEIPAAFVPSLEHSLAVIARWDAERAAGTRLVFASRDARSGELLGGCELARIADGVLNLSYWTHAIHRRRGIATRAVALALPIAFGELRANRVEAVVDADNEASRSVVLRCSFREAGLRGGKLLYVRDAS